MDKQLSCAEHTQMLNPNAWSCKLVDFTACYSEDQADLQRSVVRIHQIRYRLSCRLLAVLHADFQPVSYLADSPGSFSPSFTAL